MSMLYLVLNLGVLTLNNKVKSQLRFFPFFEVLTYPDFEVTPQKMTDVKTKMKYYYSIELYIKI